MEEETANHAMLQSVRLKQQMVGRFLAQRWHIRYLKVRDPELVKAFSRISVRLLELELCARTSELPAAAHSVIERVDRGLGREAAWDVAEQLQRLLFDCWPNERLAGALETELVHDSLQPPRRPPITWSGRFAPGELPLIIDALAPSPEQKKLAVTSGRALAIARLSDLHEARTDRVRHDRAFTGLRTSLLMAVAGALGVLTSVLVLLIQLDQPKIFITAAAGAIGSLLTGIYKLRDDLGSINQLRNYAPLLVGLPVVGATTAVFVFAAVSSGLITVGGLKVADLGWSHLALWGFLAGFSETFFLGIVKRLTAAGEPVQAKVATKTADSKTSS